MVAQTAQQYPRHDGGDVKGVLAVGGEAQDGENGPDGGAVQVAAGDQDVARGQKAVHPGVDQHRAASERADVVAGHPAGGAQERPVFLHRPAGPVGQPHADAQQAQQGQRRPQQEVVPRGPVEGGFRVEAEGLEHGHQHHGHQAAGKAQAVQVHAVLHPVGVLRHGGHHKADEQARQHPQPGAVPHRHEADHRGQGGGPQGQVDMVGKGLLLQHGVDGRAGENGPDVQDILAEQGKPSHQADGDQGRAVQRIVHQLEYGDADQSDQPGVDKGGPYARDGNVVGDQHVLVGKDGVHTPDDFLQGRLGQAECHQPHSEQRTGGEQGFTAWGLDGRCGHDKALLPGGVWVTSYMISRIL